MFRLPLLLALLSCYTLLSAQPLDTLPYAGPGAPLIQYFSPQEYKASPYNYALVQAKNGIMYIANEEGVLEFDGANWRLIQLPNKGKALSMDIDAKGTIFVGGESEFGYLIPDETGQLQYQSLLTEILHSQTGFGRVEALVATSEGIYFSTSRRLFRWDGQHMEVWEAENEGQDGFYLGFETRDAFYCERMTQGLMTVQADTLLTLGLDEIFISKEGVQPDFLCGIASLEAPWPFPAMILVSSGKMWGYEKGKSPQPFATDEAFAQYLLNNQVERMLALSDGRLAFSTLTGGIAIMNSDGKLDQLIDRQAGLKKASPINLFEDRQGGLWVAMDNGLSRVELNPAISHYDAAQGLDGGASQIKEFGDQLYVGNRSGLFRLFDQSTPFHAPFLEQIPQVPGGFTTMEQAGERLFIGTAQSLGFARLDGSLSGATTFPIVQLHYLPREEEFLWLVFPDGMALMYNDLVAESWYLIAHIPTYIQEASSIAEDAQGNIWVDYGSDVVLRMGLSNLETMLDTSAFNESFGLIDLTPEMHTYGPEKGIPLGNKKVYRVTDQILAGTLKGLKQYDPDQDRFIVDEAWGPPSTDTTFSILDLAISAAGDVWISYEKDEVGGLGRLVAQADGSYKWEEGLLKRFVQASPLTTLYPDLGDNEVIWLGNNEEIIRYNIGSEVPASQNLHPLIRSFSTKGMEQPLQAGLSIAYGQNGVTFSYGLPNFTDPKGTRYQYQLKGFEDDWSDWTSASSKEYTQLSEGTYTFSLRAKDSEGVLYEAESFSFEILPPWYRSGWAYLLYLLLFAGIITLVVRFYSQWRVRQLEERNEELSQIVDERTAEIRVKNVQLNNTIVNLQNTQQQLIVQEKMASLGQLTMGVAHEIKNPLNFVKNFAEGTDELLKEFEEDWEAYQNNPDPEALEDLKETFSLILKNNTRIIENGDRANEIVNGMMNHANDNRGEKAAVDLNQLVEESLLLAYHGFQTPENPLSIQIEKSFAENLPPIKLHAQDVGRVLINLVNNACFALAQKLAKAEAGFTPTLRASTLLTENEALIQIWDNGMGIPTDAQAKIFEPFFTTKPTGKGHVGLGLSISYDLVTQGHQGRMEVRSEPGAYTEFEIGIPLDS